MSDLSTGPLVIKLGGAAVESPCEQASLWRALGTLHQSEASGVVLVHGGGAQVDRLLTALGLPIQKIYGIRITPEDQIDHVVGVLAGTMNAMIVGALRANSINAVGLTIGSGGTVISEIRHDPEIDLGRVGTGKPGDPALVRMLLSGGFLPVLSSIGFAVDGGTLNINADEAAAVVAQTIGARAIVLLTDVPGVLDERGDLIPEIDADSLDRLIRQGVIHSGMVVKVRAAMECAQRSGCTVIIASWKQPDALARLASDDQVGTRIVVDFVSGEESNIPGVIRAV